MLLKWTLVAIAGVHVGADALAIGDGSGASGMVVERQLSGLPYGVGVGSEGLSKLMSSKCWSMNHLV